MQASFSTDNNKEAVCSSFVQKKINKDQLSVTIPLCGGYWGNLPQCYLVFENSIIVIISSDNILLLIAYQN